MKHPILFGLAIICGLFIGFTAMGEGQMGPTSDAAYEKSLEQARFIKEGLDRLHYVDYQYESIGLAGTTMRPGPHGFTVPGAPAFRDDGAMDNRPFLIHEYWWDEDGHRVTPFDLVGGYGEAVQPGLITGFRHELDIRTGVLNIYLELEVDGVGFSSRRSMFVTPQGVLAIRVQDCADAPGPFRLRFQSRPVWPKGFGGIICPPYEQVSAALPSDAGIQGFVVSAERPAACRAVLAVGIEAENVAIDVDTCTLGPARGVDTVTYYIAPGSSYEEAEPDDSAWHMAQSAASRGWQALRAETDEWWRDFYAQSSVSVPDEDIMRWYVRSLYYHGVYFGETDIPPGCFATNPAGFLGTICPEFDLAFSKFALLYTNRFSEARRIADWFVYALPQARKSARKATLHNLTVTHESGAFYSPLVGWDGRLYEPPTEGEAIYLHQKYPNANVAAMALAYLDWAQDESYAADAHQILRETTEVVVEDLEWHPEEGVYRDRYRPCALNTSSAEFMLREAITRGVADPDWQHRLDKLHRESGTFAGRKTLVPGNHRQNTGDAPWLQDLWWFGNVPGDDPRALATYAHTRHSRTGFYVFNNGWMSIHASKIGREEDALRWLKNLAKPGPGVPNPIFDETNFGEIIADWEDSAKTPEIGAHGVLICAVTQMLVDPDDKEVITVFPALPLSWREKGVAFRDLAVRGNLTITAQYSLDHVDVVVQNRSTETVTRSLRVRLPEKEVHTTLPIHGVSLNGDWAETVTSMEPGEIFRLTLSSSR